MANASETIVINGINFFNSNLLLNTSIAIEPEDLDTCSTPVAVLFVYELTL